jgi:hypothetical protein
MDLHERLDLKKLMANSDDYEDNTEGIRRLKHSDLIIADIKKIETYKNSMKQVRIKNPDQFYAVCQTKCSFLYNQYTDIFNRLIKDELDLKLMYQMLETLKKIENGNIDQQEGSVIIGKILHKIFVESAMKRADRLELNNNDVKTDIKVQGKEISWSEYKIKNSTSTPPI